MYTLLNFKKDKFILHLTFYPGLVLTGFQTTHRDVKLAMN